MDTIFDVLEKVSTAPTEKAPFDQWLELRDALAFLAFDERQDDLVIYAGFPSVFLHAVMVPVSLLSPPDTEDLLKWSFNAASGWGVSQSFSDPPSVSLSRPLEHTNSNTLDQGEQLVFARSFDGRLGDKSYYEILQPFIHVFGLHFLPERNAYCRLDQHGDIEDAIRIIIAPPDKGIWAGRVVTIKRELLDQYGALTNAVVVRTFDFTRFGPSAVTWRSETQPEYVTTGDIIYRKVIDPGYASYLRGCQIIRAREPRERLLGKLTGEIEEERQFASFLAQDFRNGVIREISCEPGATANYFTTSELPFETSPVFFRPEVLTKYKADAEKYRLEDRSMSCRGTWHLKTYDINEAGQVHTYICYLRDLPYEEQLHWKQFNQRPKAPISKRAYAGDFEGRWDQEYDPLTSIREFVDELVKTHTSWWTLRAEDLLERVHYPVTTSADEWAEELLQLDKLLVEGFEKRVLKRAAAALGRPTPPEYGSLKVAQECLIGLTFAEEHAAEVMAPLRELQRLRTKAKGHASGAEALAIKKAVLAQYGTYAKHFRALARDCDQAIRTIGEAFKRLPRGGANV